MASDKGGTPLAGLIKNLQDVPPSPKQFPASFIEKRLALAAQIRAMPVKENKTTLMDRLGPLKPILQAPFVAAGKVLEVADTPHRFVVSTVRETMDALDSDPTTSASFGDLFDQTADKHFGFGKAFPMKGWKGRIVGFVGDLATDPINWFTLGGYVSKTSQFTAKGGALVKSRTLIGRTTLGRDAREKLAQAATGRMKFLNDAELAAGRAEIWSQDAINVAYKEIGEQGKRALPDLVRKDLGVKEAGLYFLGRAKVPGTGPVASLLEQGIVSTRLGIMKTDTAKWLMSKMTPTTTGRIAEFGDDTLLKFRVGIANGTIDPADVEIARAGLSADFARRRVKGMATNDGEIAIIPLSNHPLAESMESRLHLLLDGVEDPSLVQGFTPKDVEYALLVRKQYDEFHEAVVRVFAAIDPSYEVGKIPGFFPHVTTNEFQDLSAQLHAATAKFGDTVDSEAFAGQTFITVNGQPLSRETLNELMAGTFENELTDSARLGAHFRHREVTLGKTWFGVKLEKADQLTAASLNKIARDSGKINFDIFDTGARRAMAKYVQSYGEQMGFAAMVDDVMKNSPHLLSRKGAVPSLNELSVENILRHTPAGAVEDAFNSLQTLSQVTGQFADAINKALKDIHADPAMARLLILSNKVDNKKLNTLRAAIDAASENVRLTGEATAKHVGKLRDEFDAVAAIVLQRSPEQVKEIETEMRAIQKALRQTQNAPVVPTPTGKDAWAIGLKKRKAVNAFVKGRSPDASFYEQVNQGIENGLRVLRLIQAKDPSLWTPIDNLFVAQIAAENRFWAAASRMQAADNEAQWMRQLQALLKTGEVGLHDSASGVIARNAITGEILTDIPATALVMKNHLRQGMEEFSKQFPGLETTPEFASLWKNISRFEDPVWLNDYVKTAIAFTKIHKALAVSTPGFHIRNFFANAATWVTHGVDLRSAHLVTPYYVAWLNASSVGVPWEKFLETVPDDMRIVLTKSREAVFGSGGGIYTGVMKDAQGVSKIIDFKPIKAGLKLGQESDDYFRFVMAFDSTIRGLDVGQTSARVANAYFDYEDLSKFDRIAKNIVPFWIWTSRNLQSHMSNMIFNPRPYLRYEAFKRNMQAHQLTDESYVPPTVEEQGGFKLPFGENLFAVPDLGFTRVKQQLDQIAHPQKYVSQLNPLIRVPLEQAFGQSFYSDKELEDASARIGHIVKGLVVTANMADNLILTDDQKQLNAWTSFLFGSPIKKYGPPSK